MENIMGTETLNSIVSRIAMLGIEQLLLGLAVLAVGLLATRLIMNLVERSLKHLHAIDPSLHSMLKSTLRFTLYFITVVAAAGTVGIPMTSFVALFSVVGIAVSLAVQGVLGNLAGGVIILASKPFALGHFIEADGITGTVTDIGFLYTRLLTPDGKEIFLPNNTLHSSRLVNFSSNPIRRIDLPVSAHYDCEPERVRAALLSMLDGDPDVLRDPAPEVFVDRYNESDISYVLRLWVPGSQYLPALYRLTERAYYAFRENGIEMSYPHINVHMQ